MTEPETTGRNTSVHAPPLAGKLEESGAGLEDGAGGPGQDDTHTRVCGTREGKALLMEQTSPEQPKGRSRALRA